ncbi:MAG: hypothetical protein K0R78_698 [Pelosinus sp.]|jgi:uncharacterized protein YueI|nr:hypothetical protein [Pelosinus sp.]
MQKDKVEQALLVGVHGAPELKYDEKVQYLGEFRERILRKLTKNQVREKAIYPEILQALKGKKADKLIINGSIDYRFIEKYKELATDLNKTSTVRSDPGFQGDTGLIVISNEAVEVQDITVEDRSSRLRRLGVPADLIETAGQKVCTECLSKIAEADKNELINYQQLTWIDRLAGDRCPGHK